MLEHEITSEMLLLILLDLAPLAIIPVDRNMRCDHVSGTAV
jgi:hypothetical protein